MRYFIILFMILPIIGNEQIFIIPKPEPKPEKWEIVYVSDKDSTIVVKAQTGTLPPGSYHYKSY